MLDFGQNMSFLRDASAIAWKRWIVNKSIRAEGCDVLSVKWLQRFSCDVTLGGWIDTNERPAAVAKVDQLNEFVFH